MDREVLVLADRELLTEALAKKQEADIIMRFVQDHLARSYDLHDGDSVEDDFSIHRASSPVPTDELVAYYVRE